MYKKGGVGGGRCLRAINYGFTICALSRILSPVRSASLAEKDDAWHCVRSEMLTGSGGAHTEIQVFLNVVLLYARKEFLE